MVMSVLSDAVIRDVESCLRAVGEQRRAERVTVAWRRQAAPELNVVIFGEFNRGKSTLINALLRTNVLPAKLVPTTGHVTQIVSGSGQVRAYLRNGRCEVSRLDQLDQFSLLDGKAARDDIDMIEVGTDSPLLAGGIVLIDTPGTKDSDEQTVQAERAIAQADLILMVLDATQLLGEHEQSQATRFTRELGKPVVPVVNKMNLVDTDEWVEVRQRVTRWAHQHLPDEAPLGRAFFEVNALGALRHVTGRGGARPGDDFFLLREALAGCTGERRVQLQRRARSGQLLAEVRGVEQSNVQVLRRLRQDAERVERDRREQRARREDLRRRVETLGRTGQERAITVAKMELDAAIEQVVASFTGQTKEYLEQNAERLYQEALYAAAEAIETTANRSLGELTEGAPCQPAPLTIKERLIIETRLEVGELAMTVTDATGGDVLGWAAAGAAIGSMIPGIGTLAGAGIGALWGWLSGGETKAPNYEAAYATKAREAWGESQQHMIDLLKAQYKSRVESLTRQINEQIAEAAATQPASRELAARERLAAVLSQVRATLGDAAAVVEDGAGADGNAEILQGRLISSRTAYMKMAVRGVGQ